LFQSLLKLLNMGLFLEVEWLGVDNPAITLTKDIELTETESHVNYNFISIFASSACVGQL